jgi:large subunit ribosomal protein L10
MNRKEKEIAVQQLHQNFNDSSGAFLVKYKGLSVADMQSLRKQLRDCGARVRVAKDRLVKLAVKETPAEELNSFLTDQLAVIFADDSSAAAKVVYDFSKDSTLHIVAGVVEKSLFDKEKIERLAALPSRDVLLSQLCGVLKATISNLARAVSLVAEKKNSLGESKNTESVEASSEKTSEEDLSKEKEAAEVDVNSQEEVNKSKE